MKNEDLDLRRLVNVSQDPYPSMGEKRIRNEWEKALDEFIKKNNGNGLVYEALSIQAKGILDHKPIPLNGTDISDPFNMFPVEKKSIHELAREQMENTIIAKNNTKIIGAGRLLEVEGNVEIVSLVTTREWRGRDIASKIIDGLLERSSIRPIYSFQVPNLIPFYLKRYQKHGEVQIEPFIQLPKALQRDLFYMNIFWGPYTIITIK